MNYKNKGGKYGTKRGDRAARKTHYGKFIKNPVAALPAAPTTSTAKPSSQPKYRPVSDEVTVYGAKKFRTPYSKDEFTGTQGSPIPAYVFDIDGTLQGWGQGADAKVLEWAKKKYEADPTAVFLVITARDHGSFGYESSFNWLMRNFPYPFIGPFARPKDDPRYASEFKRELAQGFEDMGLYQILGAADDNDYVIAMWKQWAKDHFEDPKDFDLLECSYGTYSSWRSGLPTKGKSYSTTSYGSSSYLDMHKDEHWDQAASKYVPNTRILDGKEQIWVKGYSDPVTKKWINGHWIDNGSAAERKQDAEKGSITEDPRWKAYFDKREAKGAYTGVDRTADEEAEEQAVADELYEEVLDEITKLDYTPDRNDLEFIVAHDHPDITPDELEAMSVYELMEKSGFWNDEELDDYLTDAIGQHRHDFATQGDKVEYRMRVEEDVWANYEDMTMEQIQNMDLVVLERLREIAWDSPANQKLYYAEQIGKVEHPEEEVIDAEIVDAGPETAPLDIAEILGHQDGSTPEGGRTYLAHGGELVDITGQETDPYQPDQHPRHDEDPVKIAQAQAQSRQHSIVTDTPQDGAA